jgi:hypothetical protein
LKCILPQQPSMTKCVCIHCINHVLLIFLLTF